MALAYFRNSKNYSDDQHCPQSQLNPHLPTWCIPVVRVTIRSWRCHPSTLTQYYTQQHQHHFDRDEGCWKGFYLQLLAAGATTNWFHLTSKMEQKYSLWTRLLLLEHHLSLLAIVPSQQLLNNHLTSLATSRNILPMFSSSQLAAFAFVVCPCMHHLTPCNQHADEDNPSTNFPRL